MWSQLTAIGVTPKTQNCDNNLFLDKTASIFLWGLLKLVKNYMDIVREFICFCISALGQSYLNCRPVNYVYQTWAKPGAALQTPL